MSQETWEILCEMEADDVELQLALQCAPLITGLKISNLLTISPEGFIRHQGKNSLCTGYWKVYADKEGKQRLFEKYEYARENLIQLLHYGLKMTEIIDICGCTAA